LILVFSQNSYSQTQDELNFKWCDKLSFTQSVLDTVVNNLKRIYADDENFINSFNIAQRNWQILLESDMEMYMPTQEYWGSSETMCECQFKEQLLNNRIRFLKKWTQPGERKGWICGGTIIFENEEILIIDGERY
tara:strand:+ start:238 stop:642 length:405 start_codon:yes stop_codon:yes gene_type:complete